MKEITQEALDVQDYLQKHHPGYDDYLDKSTEELLQKLVTILKLICAPDAEDVCPHIPELYLVCFCLDPLKASDVARLQVGLRVGKPEASESFVQKFLWADDGAYVFWFNLKFGSVVEALGSVKSHVVSFLDSTTPFDAKEGTLEFHKLRFLKSHQ